MKQYSALVDFFMSVSTEDVPHLPTTDEPKLFHGRLSQCQVDQVNRLAEAALKGVGYNVKLKELNPYYDSDEPL